MGCDAEVWAKVPEKLSWQAVKKAAVRAQAALCTERVLFTNPAHVPDPNDPDDTAERGYHSIRISREDWNDVPAAEGETILRTQMWASYYGPQYERGSWSAILGVIRFYQHAWPNCRVFYGPDSDLSKLQLVTPEFEHAQWRHLFGPYGRDYYSTRHWRFGWPAPKCDHCACDLSAANETKFYCLSCGRHWVTGGTPYRNGMKLTETESDYTTPKRGVVPTIRVPVLRLKAIARALEDGTDPRVALVDLNILLEEIT